MITATFTLPSEYGCIALIDANSFSGFVGPDWELQSLEIKLIEEINRNTMLAWGVPYGNWKIEIGDAPPATAPSRQFTGWLKTSGSLTLMSFEDIIEAAQDEDYSKEGQLQIDPGSYRCVVSQLFAESEGETESVFYQPNPHFCIQLCLDQTAAKPAGSVPWFSIS